jgi:hypothetical protein
VDTVNEVSELAQVRRFIGIVRERNEVDAGRAAKRSEDVISPKPIPSIWRVWQPVRQKQNSQHAEVFVDPVESQGMRPNEFPHVGLGSVRASD